MRTPAGEIVGVVEILNKRRGTFTKEDEEFLQEVGTHAALAVEGVRQHEAAVAARAPRGGRRRHPRRRVAARHPATWPETPGFESAPLRWRSDDFNILSYAVEAARRRGSPSSSSRTRASRRKPSARSSRRSAPGGRCSRRTRRRRSSDGCSTRSPRATSPRRPGSGDGTRPSPRRGRSCRCSCATDAPFPVRRPRRAASSRAELETAPGDLLVIASRGLGAGSLFRQAHPAGGTARVVRPARRGEHPLSAAFAKIVADGKRIGASAGTARRPGPRRAAPRRDARSAGSSSSTSSRTARWRAIPSPSFPKRRDSRRRRCRRSPARWITPPPRSSSRRVGPTRRFAFGSFRATARSPSPAIRRSARTSSTRRRPAVPSTGPRGARGARGGPTASCASRSARRGGPDRAAAAHTADPGIRRAIWTARTMARVAEALGLRRKRSRPPTSRSSRCSTGLPVLIVPVATLPALQSARPRYDRLRAVLEGREASIVYAFTKETIARALRGPRPRLRHRRAPSRFPAPAPPPGRSPRTSSPTRR